MKTEINSGMKTTEMLTRNIAKSGEVLNLGGVSPFGHHLGLIRYHSQSATTPSRKPLAFSGENPVTT